MGILRPCGDNRKARVSSALVTYPENRVFPAVSLSYLSQHTEKVPSPLGVHWGAATPHPLCPPVPKATCDFAPSGGRKAARARPSHRACAIAPRRSVHRSNSGRRPTSRSRDPECERAPEHEVFLTVMYRCTAEPSVHVYLPCTGHPPEHGHAIFHVQVIHLNIHLRTFNVQQCCCTWIMKRFTIRRIA